MKRSPSKTVDVKNVSKTKIVVELFVAWHVWHVQMNKLCSTGSKALKEAAELENRNYWWFLHLGLIGKWEKGPLFVWP